MSWKEARAEHCKDARHQGQIAVRFTGDQGNWHEFYLDKEVAEVLFESLGEALSQG